MKWSLVACAVLILIFCVLFYSGRNKQISVTKANVSQIEIPEDPQMNLNSADMKKFEQTFEPPK